MIISASRRTDIPAFYGDWFINRIEAGFVYVRSPFDYRLLSKVPLRADLVDMIVFWTKDPEPFLDKLKILDEKGYKYYFQFTLNPYGKNIEAGLRDKSEIIKTFIELSKRIGKDKVIWRYDPILIGGSIDVRYHLTEFSRYADLLSDYTETVTISFFDFYKKVLSKKSKFRELTDDEMVIIGDGFVSVAKEHHLSVKTCAESIVYKNGIEKASCIDAILISKILGEKLSIEKYKSRRKDCECFENVDIGQYDSCPHLCQYCYANTVDKKIINNSKIHNPASPLLIGNVSDGDTIKEKICKSNKTGQSMFFV